MCSQRQGRICLVVVRPVAGPEGPVEQQCSDRMTGSNSYWPVHPAGATGALTSTGSDPRLESNRLPRCSVFKDRVPRGHLFRVVCSDPTGSRSRRSDHPTPWRGWTIPRGGGESVVDAASDSKAARYDTTLKSQCQRPALLSWRLSPEDLKGGDEVYPLKGECQPRSLSGRVSRRRGGPAAGAW